jgi:hypothetical protein
MLDGWITRIGEGIRTLMLDESTLDAQGDVVFDVCTARVGNCDELVRVGSRQIGGPPPMALGDRGAGPLSGVTRAAGRRCSARRGGSSSLRDLLSCARESA